ncbi:MAG TPA: hypothetical protein DEQ40_08090 [Oxalobacteraceae bacterium]|nr:hypothetical protein [Oxalobacteraceae bacterium]
MISYAEPLPIGNAVRVLLAPATGATGWKLLRKVSGAFSGPTDPAAAVIYDGSDETNILDTGALTNGTPYYYCSFELVGAAWSASTVVSITPATLYNLGGPDTLSLVRDRLELGLRAAVAAGILTHDNGYVPVLTAPPLYENTKWPVVSVHLQNDAPMERGIGEEVVPDRFDAANADWDTSEGWLSGVTIQIIGWSLNPDERIALRKAIKNIVIGNFQVFDAAGMDLITLQQSDIEDFESYAAPVYQTCRNFNCIAPNILTSTLPPITDVTVDAEAA